MFRDYSRDLTIVVAGTGKTNVANFKDNMTDFILGALDDPKAVSKRELTIILPIMDKSGPVLDMITKYAMMADADVRVIQTKRAPMNRELSALEDIVKGEDEHDTLSKTFELLEERRQAGDETFFIMAFNEDSVYTQGESAMSDLEILYEAKSHPEVIIINLNGMIDSFEGYESAEEKQIREDAEAAFAEAKAAEEAAKPAPAKKAAAPRKRAAKKTAAPKATPVLEEAEKPLEDAPAPTSGLDKLVADAVARDKAQQTQTLELKADVVMTSQLFPKPELVPVTTEDVWADIAKAARPTAVDLRRDELLAELGENIAAMGDAFSKTIRTYAALIEEIR